MQQLDVAMASTRNAFDLHNAPSKRRITKFENYFEIYDRYMHHLRGTNCRILEIGVQHGGSLQMWRSYLGPSAQIVGLDINKECLRFVEPNTDVMIGDQGDTQTLIDVSSKLGEVDVIIDDGSHIPLHQRQSFDVLFERNLKPGGTYIVEDCHTSYHKGYGGGLRARGSFIEFSKGVADIVNHWHSGIRRLGEGKLATSVLSVSFFSSVVVFEKRLVACPNQCSVGDLMIDLDAPFRKSSIPLLLFFKRSKFVQRAVRTNPLLWSFMKKVMK